MIKALRMVKEKVSGPVGEGDVEDRKRVKDIQDAAAALHKTMGVYFKVLADHNSTTAALHEDLANLYPAGQGLSTAVAQLNAASAGQLFADANAMLEEMRKLLEPPVDKILARTRELLALIEERRVLRAEVEHYKEKVTRLANEGLADTKKQAKAESNQSKLLANQKRARELDTILGAALPELDGEIAGYVDRAIAGYVALQASHAAQLATVYSAAAAAVPGGGAVAPSSSSSSSSSSSAPAAEPAAASASLSDFLGGGAASSGAGAASGSGSVASSLGKSAPTAAAVAAAAADDDGDAAAAVPPPAPAEEDAASAPPGGGDDGGDKSNPFD